MKKLILVFTLIPLLLTTLLHATTDVVVSIVPQRVFVEAIGKEHVDVTVMVPPGASPHSYEPKVSQMQALSAADIYFSIGVEFEQAWLPRFIKSNPSMQHVSLDQTIKKIDMIAHHDDESELHDHHDHDDEEKDPHIWLSPVLVAHMAKEIAATLIEHDPKNSVYYQKNLHAFLQELNQLDAAIKERLRRVKQRNFLVYHPSWGYYAKEYNLTQLAIEVEGKSPKPKALMQMIKTIKTLQANVLIVQPEFSDKSAKTLATELNLQVIKISPLSASWKESLLELTNAIAK